MRGTAKLEIIREEMDDGVVLIIAGEAAPRSYFFREPERLETFQKDMETLLLKTGWTFVAYAPNQRSGGDRRGWPRRANDRRRWWTDGSTSQRADQHQSGSGDTHEPKRPRSSEKK